MSVVAIVIAWISVTSAQSGAKPPAPAATAAKASKPSSVPRTPDGRPDLQGTWNLATLTPMERPLTAKGRDALSDAEAASIEQGEAARVAKAALPSRGDRTAPPKGGDGSIGAAGGVGGYNNFWIDRGSKVFTIDGQRRTALVIDPPDGRVPPMLPEARARNARNLAPTADAPENDANRAFAPGNYEEIERHPLAERCILGFGSTSGPPTLPNYFYNNLKQIVQTPDYVLINVEMIHDARIVRMNQPHLPKTIRKWLGDSVGHWEGDTLVVDTTNFNEQTRFRGSTENLHIVERFTRVDANTLLYRFTVEDPATWATPWTGEFPWEATNDMMYEYACHESNYAFGAILRGARLLEAEAEASRNKK
jgi:hypothetical protein